MTDAQSIVPDTPFHRLHGLVPHLVEGHLEILCLAHGDGEIAGIPRSHATVYGEALCISQITAENEFHIVLALHHVYQITAFGIAHHLAQILLLQRLVCHAGI